MPIVWPEKSAYAWKMTHKMFHFLLIPSKVCLFLVLRLEDDDNFLRNYFLGPLFDTRGALFGQSKRWFGQLIAQIEWMIRPLGRRFSLPSKKKGKLGSLKLISELNDRNLTPAERIRHRTWAENVPKWPHLLLISKKKPLNWPRRPVNGHEWIPKPLKWAPKAPNGPQKGPRKPLKPLKWAPKAPKLPLLGPFWPLNPGHPLLFALSNPFATGKSLDKRESLN